MKIPGMIPIGAFVKNGAIIPAWSAKSDWMGTPVERLCCLRWAGADSNCVLAGTDDGKIYMGPSGSKLELKHEDGGTTPFVVEMFDGNAHTMLISGNSFTTAHGRERLHGGFTQNLSCGVMRCGRLFGADADKPYVLKWSGRLGFADWVESISGAGRLGLEADGGYIIDLFDFEDALIILRENSVMRYSVYGDPENFRKISSVTVPKVFKHSAAIAGDSLLFVTQGGLMRYRGGKVEKVDGLISDDMISAHSCVVHDGRYYFVCGLSRGLNRNVIYAYDFIDDCYEIIDKNVDFISQDGESAVAYTSVNIFRMTFDNEFENYSVTTGNINFGTTKRKLATMLEVDCDEGVKAYVYNGSDRVRLGYVKGRVRLNIRGTDFRVIFESQKGVVRSAKLTAEVIG